MALQYQFHMRKTNQEITEKKVLDEILTQSRICRIAMIDHGLPYLLPFNYGYQSNCIYIHTATVGKKLDILRNNPIVCFEIELTAEVISDETACKWATRYRSVIGNGHIDIISDFDQKILGLEIIMKHNGAPPPYVFESGHIDSLVILKLNIDTITGKQSSNWDKITERQN